MRYCFISGSVDHKSGDTSLAIQKHMILGAVAHTRLFLGSMMFPLQLTFDLIDFDRSVQHGMLIYQRLRYVMKPDLKRSPSST